jgi:predicted metal-dependent hydrolase
MQVKIETQKGLAEITKEERFKISQPLKKSDLLEIIDAWQEKLKVNPDRVQIRKMRNKWSSCSSKGNITLNSELTRLPREIAKYVIVHELLHLIVPNHGKTFKVLLSAYLPDWEELHYKLASCSSLFLSKTNNPHGKIK